MSKAARRRFVRDRLGRFASAPGGGSAAPFEVSQDGRVARLPSEERKGLARYRNVEQLRERSDYVERTMAEVRRAQADVDALERQMEDSGGRAVRAMEANPKGFAQDPDYRQAMAEWEPLRDLRNAAQERMFALRRDLPSEADEQRAANASRDHYADRAWEATASRPLAPGEIDAVRRYIGSGYSDVNRHLRTGSALEQRSSLVAELDAVTTRTRAPQDTVVYRQINDHRMAEEIGRLRPGETFTDPAYVSTSLNPRRARAKSPIVMTVLVPKGTPSAYVADGFVNTSENEVLLARNLPQRVVSTVVGKDGVLRLVTEVLP